MTGLREATSSAPLCPFSAELNWSEISRLFKRQGVDGAGERPVWCRGTFPGSVPENLGGGGGRGRHTCSNPALTGTRSALELLTRYC